MEASAVLDSILIPINSHKPANNHAHNDPKFTSKLLICFRSFLVVFPGHPPVAMAHLDIAAHVLPLHHLPQQLVGESGLDIICMDGLKLKWSSTIHVRVAFLAQFQCFSSLG